MCPSSFARKCAWARRNHHHPVHCRSTAQILRDRRRPQPDDQAAHCANFRCLLLPSASNLGNAGSRSSTHPFCGLISQKTQLWQASQKNNGGEGTPGSDVFFFLGGTRRRPLSPRCPFLAHAYATTPPRALSWCP